MNEYQFLLLLFVLHRDACGNPLYKFSGSYVLSSAITLSLTVTLHLLSNSNSRLTCIQSTLPKLNPLGWKKKL